MHSPFGSKDSDIQPAAVLHAQDAKVATAWCSFGLDFLRMPTGTPKRLSDGCQAVVFYTSWPFFCWGEPLRATFCSPDDYFKLPPDPAVVTSEHGKIPPAAIRTIPASSTTEASSWQMELQSAISEPRACFTRNARLHLGLLWRPYCLEQSPICGNMLSGCV